MTVYFTFTDSNGIRRTIPLKVERGYDEDGEWYYDYTTVMDDAVRMANAFVPGHRVSITTSNHSVSLYKEVYEECSHGLSAWLCEDPINHYPPDIPF
jgi:hypothetical protein